MGQKIDPRGLRISVNRKWDSSWFASGTDYKNLFFHQKQAEEYFKSFLHYYSYTKTSFTKRLLLVDLKIFKYSSNNIFIFVFFYKLRTKKRSRLVARKRTFSNKSLEQKQSQWKKNIKYKTIQAVTLFK